MTPRAINALRKAACAAALVLCALGALAADVSPVFTYAASAARTTSGDCACSISLGRASELLVFLDITAASGTSPTLTVTVEVFDGTSWYTHTSFAQKTAAGRDMLKLTNFGQDVRVSWTIGGTGPSFTFAVKGQSKVQ